VPVRFTQRAQAHVGEFPEIRDLIKARVRALSEPDAAEQLGHQCRGELRRCRTIKLGANYRMVYMVRKGDPIQEDDVVVIAIGRRKDEAAYAVAARVLFSEDLPAREPRSRRGDGGGGVPPRRRQRGRRGSKRRRT
jgi:hypothetical protein